MLFSAADTWYGDPRSWPVYHCSQCRHAFLFPAPSADEFHELNYREARADDFRVLQPEQGLYRLFARPAAIGGSAFYQQVESRLPRWWREASDLCRVRERAAARILEVGGGRGRMVEALAARGFRDITCVESHGPHADRLESLGCRVLRGAVTEIVFAPGEYDAAVFHLSLAYLHNPVDALRHVARAVKKGGSIYISTPNLDSVWLDRYGPVWSPWHAPYHLSTYSRKSVRILAEKAGLAVESLRTNSPAHWLAMSDRLAPLGASGAAPPDPVQEDADLMRLARAASFTSAVRHDWRGRGDCLHVRLRVG
jgi:SAM-dependent methyltransferase